MSATLEAPAQIDSRPTDDGFRKRVQLDFAKDGYDRLVEMKEATSAGTLTKVIRQALLLFDWYVTYKRQGYSLQMKGPDGQVIDAPDLHRTY
jgi:hypothetical protein